ncbi:hypothetical protein C1I97_29215 [Streptomyces sp. NTH33]|uniref:hypothetical protein n=1 Tax=Streptomyces sp. NTH33 TaxID=1735453 RepID=UPI000DAA25A7|nr:hypothetical protein [Streptomyces sp. NTH33]PZG92723.1 hypothetical protein C1I97_29215 [Streptomyces sp. NTH33]
MTDHRGEAPGENGTPVPRDLPDQQARTDEDESAPHPGTEPSGREPSDEREPSEHPVPDEPSG